MAKSNQSQTAATTAAESQKPQENESPAVAVQTARSSLLQGHLDSLASIRSRHPNAQPERLVEELERSLRTLPPEPRNGHRPVFLHIQVTPQTAAFYRDLVQTLKFIERDNHNAVSADKS